MRRAIHLGIEPLVERYSVQWRKWFAHQWFGEVYFIDVEPLGHTIEVGSFLDVYGTCFHKAAQMAEAVKFARRMRFGETKGDWFFLHDLWSPSLLQLLYMRSGAGLCYKIAGCLHAGCWDEHDFLRRTNMDEWAVGLEEAMLIGTDLIFVATQFHKDLILKYYDTIPGLPDKLKVTGFPIFRDFRSPSFSKVRSRSRLVVFPHRKDPEKQPELFLQLAASNALKKAGYTFCFTKDECRTKKEYYRMLEAAEFAVSFALQETWGIAMQEATMSYCIPLVPDRLSYPEMYPRELRYSDFRCLEGMLAHAACNPEYKWALTTSAHAAIAHLAQAGEGAISNMQEEMEKHDS